MKQRLTGAFRVSRRLTRVAADVSGLQLSVSRGRTEVQKMIKVTAASPAMTDVEKNDRNAL
jgi:hypothetical protein